ncbi:hypothetical protein G6F44_006566 [Rhizopus delemar]|nr:hypothetical protein G6F44_006566 [Rhizopus delemar]
MSDINISTTSYEEAMNLSDLDEYEFPNDSMSTVDEQPNTPSTKNDTTLDPPIKIRKKPGRKPNPASPALRKAQNRAAQRAFRERKERHTKELEAGIRTLKEERDRLLKENEKVTDENEVLKAENWYLKGIVLSLQLICLQQGLVIPQHCPHINEETLGVLAQSIPQSISSYLNVNAKNKLQLSSRVFKRTSEPQVGSQDVFHTTQQQQQCQQQQQQCQQQQQAPLYDPQQSSPMNQWNAYHTPKPDYAQSDEAYFSNMPPLSPVTVSEKSSSGNEIPRHVPNEPVISNLAAIQSLRLQLRLQSASMHIPCTSAATQPTLLQLTIPHDPRIDLIPAAHMRDRMILFRDLFDLDDCFRCLLSGSVFHGGDPAVAGNWQLPVEFFEKYWFLTIDYNLRRYTNEWRKKQGLEEIQLPTASTDIPSQEPSDISQMQLADGFSMMGISPNQSLSSSLWDDFNTMLSSSTNMNRVPF